MGRCVTSLIYLFAASKCFVSSSFENTNDEIVVETQLGHVRGIVQHALDNTKPVYAFYSIPYAEPPIGRNRFQPPKPAKPWTGVKDATKIGKFCIQHYAMFNEACSLLKLPLMQPDNPEFYSEDCLELDIYTPNVNAQLPVMFWIHGGGFTTGSGHVYNGTALSALNDVVVVSINYRLSYLGFLSTGDKLLPGNMGLKDQVEALKWVKQNIRAFGGDPDRVTIFGESAGSWSVASHLVSPMSKDLFKYAILQSGSILSDKVTNENPAENFNEIAESLECTNGTRNDLIECVRQTPVDDIEKAIATLGPLMKFDWVSVDGEFFPKHPKYLYDEADFSDTVILIGTTEHETHISLSLWSHDGKYNYETFLEEIKFLNGAYCQQDTVSLENLNKIANFYLDNDISEIDEKTYNAKALEITTDFTMEFPVLNLTNTVVERGGKAFLYIFSHIPEYMDAHRSRRVSTHTDDIFFTFGFGFMELDTWFKQLEVTYSEKETIFARQMMKYWVNFATYGDPNSDDLSHWPKYSLDNEEYAILKEQPTVGKLFRKEKFQFWKDFMQSIQDNRQKYGSKRDEL
ncbi:unnamed protein product [Owenia fusiformis]|uniref:Carboxylic ester hydrolase n=1 Tax=Owenia fusiformis TaxID=6347 RepID=A0A8J1T6A8_OWEFU|nr:unnamed protein product [Owenia fusiformis]